MMDKFSLIGLGCFKIFEGSTLWMRSRGLTLRPLFEWVVNSTTSKNGDFGCSLAGFKYPVPTCYTPTSSPLPLDSSQQKRTWKNESKNHPKKSQGNKSTTDSITIFFQFDSQPLQTLQQNLPLGGKLGGKMPSTSPICPTELSILIVGSPVAVVKQNGFNPNGFIFEKKTHDTKLVSKMYGDMPKVFLQCPLPPEIILAKDQWENTILSGSINTIQKGCVFDPSLDSSTLPPKPTCGAGCQTNAMETARLVRHNRGG